MDDIKQIFEAAINLYKGNKLNLEDRDFGYLLKFKMNDGWRAELDCRIVKEGQKTLSATKPVKVTVKSYQDLEDIGYTIQGVDNFTIHDIDDMIGKGKITNIISQS